MDRAVEPTLAALRRRGIDYRGVLYAGLMLTPDGPKMIEYNVRFGDPEAQVVLPRLTSDLAELLAAGRRRRADRRPPTFTDDAAVTVVLASRGLPGVAPHRRRRSTGSTRPTRSTACTVFSAGVAADADGRLVTAGGRVLAVTGRGRRSPTPVTLAYRRCRRDRLAGACSTAPTSPQPRHRPREERHVKVGVLMGSPNDSEKMAKAADTLERFGLEADVRVLSAHRNPHQVVELVVRAPGRTATWPSSAAPAWPRTWPAWSPPTPPCPVVGVPLSGGALNGVDALYSTVQMPKGIPVATVAIDGR